MLLLKEEEQRGGGPTTTSSPASSSPVLRKQCAKRVKAVRKSLRHIDYLSNEVYLLQRLIYKFRNQLHADKSFQLMRRVNKLIAKIHPVSFQPLLTDLASVVSQAPHSKRAFDLLSVFRTKDALLEQLCDSCLKGAALSRQHLAKGLFMNFHSIFVSVIARIYALSSFGRLSVDQLFDSIKPLGLSQTSVHQPKSLPTVQELFLQVRRMQEQQKQQQREANEINDSEEAASPDHHFELETVAAADNDDDDDDEDDDNNDDEDDADSEKDAALGLPRKKPKRAETQRTPKGAALKKGSTSSAKTTTTSSSNDVDVDVIDLLFADYA